MEFFSSKETGHYMGTLDLSGFIKMKIKLSPEYWQVSLLTSVCSDTASQPQILLPVQGEGDWALLHTSPHLDLLPGQLSLVLLGELDKINPLSGVREAFCSLIGREQSRYSALNG